MSLPKKPRCETCRWFDASKFDPSIGVCRVRSVPAEFFPRRHRADWCGEHMPEVGA